jgi:hypothetical protein
VPDNRRGKKEKVMGKMGEKSEKKRGGGAEGSTRVLVSKSHITISLEFAFMKLENVNQIFL